MKRDILSTFVTVVLLTGVLAALPSSIGPLSGGTIYVDDDNTSGIEDGSLLNPYNTIQEGVDAEAAGDTVYVFAGTYMENVWMDKNLILEGEDTGTTIIDTGTTPPLCDSPAITVVADNASISGFSTLNGVCGIAVGFSSGCQFFNINMTTLSGMEMYNSSENSIFGNNLLNVSFGISLENSHGNTIMGNHFEESGFCIRLYKSLDNVVTNNHITGGGFCIDLKYSNETFVSNNTISDSQFGVDIYESMDNVVCGNTILNGTSGIDLRSSSRILVESNNVSRHSSTGIELWESDNCTVADNTLVSNLNTGINIHASRSNTVINNDVSGSQDGISVQYDSDANLVFNNTLHSNTENGLYLYSSSFCILANNTVHSNQWNGMFIRGDSFYNMIHYNYIHSNVEEGISVSHNPENNLIHHNHLEANNGATDVYNSSRVQAKDLSINFWDDGYPSGGNYWSDWLAPDALSGPAQDVPGADGIVDLPYLHSIGKQDLYPLTRSPLGPAGPPNATIDLDPDTLNLKSKGKWITCYIELPAGYDPRDINASTILLKGTVSPEMNPKYGFVKSESSYIMDHDNDTIEERMVKFDRSAVQQMIGQPYESIALNVTGELFDGTPFSGFDTIRVTDPPKKKP
ncbi:MAG: right-handed parallel beta-helix repeat-containing protein [Thermoplasmata archaeon]|nr:MAG: right-handed parallel beta-helix repeat-containing protein [Thermoplasmata archaeon]